MHTILLIQYEHLSRVPLKRNCQLFSVLCERSSSDAESFSWVSSFCFHFASVVLPRFQFRKAIKDKFKAE